MGLLAIQAFVYGRRVNAVMRGVIDDTPVVDHKCLWRMMAMAGQFHDPRREIPALLDNDDINISIDFFGLFENIEARAAAVAVLKKHDRCRPRFLHHSFEMFHRLELNKTCFHIYISEYAFGNPDAGMPKRGK